MQEEIEKRYWSIGELAQEIQVTPSLLRHWEKEIDMIKPYKNDKGTRYYTQKDIEIIRTVYHLVKEKGYTLKGAQESIRNNFVKESSEAYLVSTLIKLKELLLEIKENL
jgi:DNA-binding transcriptional MerR regulator